MPRETRCSSDGMGLVQSVVFDGVCIGDAEIGFYEFYNPESLIMKKLLLVLLLSVMATGTLSAGEQATASEEGTLPESWEQ